MKKVSLILSAVMVFTINIVNAQSKKKQVENLTFSLDSLNQVVAGERQNFNTTLDSLNQLLSKNQQDFELEMDKSSITIKNLNSKIIRLNSINDSVNIELITKEQKIDSLTLNNLKILADIDWLSNPKTVTIGKQVWMSENLDVDKFRNGDPIPEAKTGEEWYLAGAYVKEPAWCYYVNDPANGAKYGKLYNWYAVNDSRGLAPIGWHVPSDKEWTVLTDYLGGEDVASTKMKSKSGWDGTNASGFSALPAGDRFTLGSFTRRGSYGFWWSSSETSTTRAQSRFLYSSQAGVARDSLSKAHGFSVRCLKD